MMQGRGNPRKPFGCDGVDGVLQLRSRHPTRIPWEVRSRGTARRSVSHPSSASGVLLVVPIPASIVAVHAGLNQAWSCHRDQRARSSCTTIGTTFEDDDIIGCGTIVFRSVPFRSVSFVYTTPSPASPTDLGRRHYSDNRIDHTGKHRPRTSIRSSRPVLTHNVTDYLCLVAPSFLSGIRREVLLVALHSRVKSVKIRHTLRTIGWCQENRVWPP